jgi:CarD family transcriptional regulator
MKAANTHPPVKAVGGHSSAKAVGNHAPAKAANSNPPAKSANGNPPAKAANSNPPAKSAGNPHVKAVGGSSHVKAVGGNPNVKAAGGNPALVKAVPAVAPVKAVGGNPALVKAVPAIAPVKAAGGKRKLEFAPADFVVYPTHGVGRIVKVEQREISGFKLDLFVIEFEKDRMTLRVPVGKAGAVGMRRLSSPQTMRSALETLKGRARIKRTMWSRRAQEYEAKINSGNPISIAEVLRDLHRNAGQPDQSYSERQIYEAALDRLARELAAVERIDEESATKRLEKVLQAA